MTKVLLSATSMYMIILTAFLLYNYERVFLLIKHLPHTIKLFSPLRLSLLILFFSVSYLFFYNHLLTSGTEIKTSLVYWDFHWHVRLINNFAFGNNFPPQNESISGVYNVYHYFWALIPATYEVLGLQLTTAINLYSALFLTGIMLFSYGIIKQYADSKIAYILVPLSIVTHGSLYFITLLPKLLTTGIASLFYSPRPDLLDFSVPGVFGYNGNMLNMFYFIEERQLIFASLALLICLYLLLEHSLFTRKFLFFSGVLFGLFLQWHLFVSTMMVTVSISYLFWSYFFQRTQVKQLSFFVIPLSVLLFFFAGALKLYSLLSPEFLHIATAQYPRINVEFSTMPYIYPFSIWHFILYWINAYGVRLVVYMFFFLYTWRNNKKLFYLLLSILPVFLFINTVQLSPLSIYDNHKWLKPFNVVLDLFAFSIFLLELAKSKNRYNYFGIVVILIGSFLSGSLSLLAYTFQKPVLIYADTKFPAFSEIQKTPPSAIFMSNSPKYVFLAGRKTYLADYLGGDLGINTIKREEQQKTLFSLPDKAAMCTYLSEQKLIPTVHYVYKESSALLFSTQTCPTVARP